MSYGVPNDLKAVIVSDVHLGYQINNVDQSNVNEFQNFVQNFLANKQIEYFIMLGDIIDLWRRDSPTVIGLYDSLMSQIGGFHNISHKYYIIGNHDYLIRSDPRTSNWGFQFEDVFSQTIGGSKFRFIHGYQIEYRDILDFYKWVSATLCDTDATVMDVASHVWQTYEVAKRSAAGMLEVNQGWLSDLITEDLLRNPDERSLRYRALGLIQKILAILRDLLGKETAEDIRNNAKETSDVNLQDDEFLVFGHTHDAFNENLIANAGCWIKGKPNTYLYIDDTGKLEKKNWP